MYSLNVPIPGAVARLASDLYPTLFGFDAVRDDLTLVVKRLDANTLDEYARAEREVRSALAGAPAFEARIDHLDAFETPARGPGPVVYLAVESPGLRSLHRRLATRLTPVPEIEGEDYVPHVTLARGGDPALAERLVGREVGPVTWTVDRLQFWDAQRGEQIRPVSLPA